MTYNGYNLREAGVNEITEIAVAFTNALEASLEMMRRGHTPDSFLDRMAMGGLVKAIEKGWLHRKIAEFSYNEYKLVQEGTIKLVGVNYAVSKDNQHPTIDVFRYPEDAEQRQSRRLEEVKRSRSNDEVHDRLERIKEAALQKENLFPYVLEAVRARARGFMTEGYTS